ncbi:hypothetical protein [Undibacterium pigrum]|nr:hypothetical protein [Undibacterium pigrum]
MRYTRRKIMSIVISHSYPLPHSSVVASALKNILMAQHYDSRG